MIEPSPFENKKL